MLQSVMTPPEPTMPQVGNSPRREDGSYGATCDVSTRSHNFLRPMPVGGTPEKADDYRPALLMVRSHSTRSSRRFTSREWAIVPVRIDDPASELADERRMLSSRDIGIDDSSAWIGEGGGGEGGGTTPWTSCSEITQVAVSTSTSSDRGSTVASGTPVSIRDDILTVHFCRRL